MTRVSSRTRISCRKVLTYVLVATVQDSLVASTVLADTCQSLDDAETKFLPLLTFVNGNIFNVANASETAEEFPLDEDGSNRDNPVRGLVYDDYPIVCVCCRLRGVELRDPSLLAWVCNHSEDREHSKVAALVVTRCEWANLSKPLAKKLE